MIPTRTDAPTPVRCSRSVSGVFPAIVVGNESGEIVMSSTGVKPAPVAIEIEDSAVAGASSAEFLADLYAGLGSHRNDFRNLNLHRLIASLVRGESVLDIGCGSATLLTILRRRGHTVFGLEPNEALVKNANARDTELKVFHGTGESVNTLGLRFETITIIDVLEHIEDDRSQLARIHAALAPGGQLIVLVPAFQALYGKRDLRNGHYRRYSRKELVGKMQDAGFSIDSSRHWNALGFVPYWFSERVLRRELNGDIRTDKAKSWPTRLVIRALHAWYRKLENNISLGFGLSLIVTATRQD